MDRPRPRWPEDQRVGECDLTRLAAARVDLVLPSTAGKLDQVLMQFEPDAVVAVDAGRGDEAVIPGQRLLYRADEPQPIIGEARAA